MIKNVLWKNVKRNAKFVFMVNVINVLKDGIWINKNKIVKVYVEIIR